MGWFDEQIKNRIAGDKAEFEDSFLELSASVLGGGEIIRAMNSDKKRTKNAIEEIIKYYDAKVVTVPPEIKEMNEQLDYMLRPTGIMKRRVSLTGEWWKEAIGAMLASTKDGNTIALVPSGFKGYSYKDYETGKTVKINKTTAKLIEEEAFCFYRPMPQRPIKIRDLVVFIFKSLNISDYVLLLMAMAVATGLGYIVPDLQKLLFNDVINIGKMSLLVSVGALYLGIKFSNMFLDITNSLIQSRISIKMSMATECAAMTRILSLPASFFKNYNAGDMAQRLSGVSQLCSVISNTIFGTGLSTLFSVVYVFQVNKYAPSLLVPALIITFVTLGFSVVSVLMQLKVSRKLIKIATKLQGVVFALFSGIQKIKLAGAEKRAFSKWVSAYKEQAKYTYDPPLFLKINPIISTILSSAGSLVLYYFAGINHVTPSDYIAFMTSYGMVSGAFASLISIATTFATVKPLLELVEPILKAEPEISDDKKQVTKLTGNIEINNLSFRYTEDGPLILDNLNLKIKPGQYIAIVGKTGCGKSTLMRLLLGFEKPNKGGIYYDGKDISKIDLKSLRRNIGVVMQNGTLFSGDIFSNIVISAPHLTLDDAWEAARLAGIDKDIEKMPMEMHTVISEGSGGVSGGQKQRLMIARAIAPKPKILMFDEATSALDNITQKQVSDSITSLNTTRIVIAHRLSTIKECDRIVVLDGGKIIEDGKFDELVEKGGYFAELVRRQMA